MLNANLTFRGVWGDLSSPITTLLLALIVLYAAPATIAQQKRTAPTPTSGSASPVYRHAWQHGYRAGYEDGYAQGKSDYRENGARDFASTAAYNDANRTYRESMGTLSEYRAGYRLAFEIAYLDGYYGRLSSPDLPANAGRIVVAALNSREDANTKPEERAPLKRRDESEAGGDTGMRRSEAPPRDRDAGQTGSRARGMVSIPDGLEMKIRLTSRISSVNSLEGDRFTATVLDPSDYADATIEGHIAKLRRSGKATGKTELSLAFDTILLRDGRSGRMAGQVVRIYESNAVKTVDEEGNVQTGSRSKDTATRTAGGATLGAIIGGITGGGKGAAIGAIIGAGAGVGSVLIQDGKSLILDPGTEMLIKTAAATGSNSRSSN